MIPPKYLVALLPLLAACAKQPGSNPATSATVPTVAQAPTRLLNNQMDSLSYAIGVNIGSAMKSQGLDSLNLDVLSKAIDATISSDSLMISETGANAFLSDYFHGRQTREAERNRKAGEEFLSKNKTQQGVATTASGLQYQVLKEGTGAKPGPNDKVTVHYLGTTLDGKKFDSSYDRGTPATFPVGGVIPGWTEALQLMKAGSKYKIFLPAQLAYGENGSGPAIGPNSVLVFEVELISVEKGK
jgi:FKBP-type peptidyl-prolyl cis-trans isomerase FklB